MIVHAKIDSWGPEWTRFIESQTSETWEELLKFLDPIVDGLPRFEDTEKFRSSMKYFQINTLMTVDEVLQLQLKTKLQVTISKVRGLFYNVDPSEALKDTQIASRSCRELHVHVPGGISTLSIKSVTVLENACTDTLQSSLDDGWRIVAVCPANDTRRPSYILGKE